MNNRKCPHCGLVNFASAAECRRCAAPLDAAPAGGVAWATDFDERDAGEFAEGGRRRGLLRRAAWVTAVTCVLLVLCRGSLLWTSRAASLEQRAQVERAVALIERGGFTREAFLLRRLTNFRTTDNWWNAYNGHEEAYAAANFPFQVVTLYPDFFHHTADDVERALILLHEARHLAGAGEEGAFSSVWRDKSRLGWTREKYGRTRVWKNVSEFTRRYAPRLFACGEDGRQDCLE